MYNVVQYISSAAWSTRKGHRTHYIGMIRHVEIKASFPAIPFWNQQNGILEMNPEALIDESRCTAHDVALKLAHWNSATCDVMRPHSEDHLNFSLITRSCRCETQRTLHETNSSVSFSFCWIRPLGPLQYFSADPRRGKLPKFRLSWGLRELPQQALGALERKCRRTAGVPVGGLPQVHLGP